MWFGPSSMGSLNYLDIDRYLDRVESNSVFVEIGSDRGEGSTPHLADLAMKYHTVLHTVDIEDRRRQSNYRSNIIWHRARGSEWAANTWPSLGHKICLLFLDNEDWTYDSDTESNHHSQQEHLLQIMHLLPWLTTSAVISCDDTYMIANRDTWTGKCALGIPLMLANGFAVVEQTLHSGTILARRLDKHRPS